MSSLLPQVVVAVRAPLELTPAPESLCCSQSQQLLAHSATTQPALQWVTLTSQQV